MTAHDAEFMLYVYTYSYIYAIYIYIYIYIYIHVGTYTWCICAIYTEIYISIYPADIYYIPYRILTPLYIYRIIWMDGCWGLTDSAMSMMKYLIGVYHSTDGVGHSSDRQVKRS